MRHILLIVCFLFSITAWTQVEKAVPPVPNPSRAYNDLTRGRNFITGEQADFLERKLKAYKDSTSSEVVIVIVEDLKDYTANEFATALGRKWGVGGKEFSNGVVILVSTGGGDGNRDAYIATGYGLEGAIPDITAKRIIENELIPQFREGNYYSGLNRTVDAIIKAAAGEYTAPKGSGAVSEAKAKRLFFTFLVVFFIIIAIIRRNNKGGGGYASRRGYRGFGGPFWWGAGGGWSGGSSGGGWSGGGGGFGGFGGGSFGGGGAGGKW